jgi:glucosamine-6-phosphate deaminase
MEQLPGHPHARVPLIIFPDPESLYRAVAQLMVEEAVTALREDRPLRWVLPCGPTQQYQIFTEIVNRERIPLRHVHVFHMDELLDWQGRPLPIDHPFSFKGYMLRCFYGRIDPDLNIPESQRHFPDPLHLDALSEAIEAVGGIDTVYGGIGFHGHIALNEPIYSPWYTVTVEEYRRSRTRILPLSDDTIIALSQRMAGGCTHLIPPMAITIGMADILQARRIRLFSATGSWKQTVLRILLFAPPTVEYPVTLVQGHPDVLVMVDRWTASHPLAEGTLGVQ